MPYFFFASASSGLLASGALSSVCNVNSVMMVSCSGLGLFVPIGLYLPSLNRSVNTIFDTVAEEVVL